MTKELPFFVHRIVSLLSIYSVLVWWVIWEHGGSIALSRMAYNRG